MGTIFFWLFRDCAVFLCHQSCAAGRCGDAEQGITGVCNNLCRADSERKDLPGSGLRRGAMSDGGLHFYAALFRFQPTTVDVRAGSGYGSGLSLHIAVLHEAVYQRSSDYFPFFPVQYGLCGSDDDPRLCSAFS